MKFKRYLPTRDQLRSSRSLEFLGDVIFEPNLWHFNRYSLSFAALVGGVCCFLPIPFQMIPCALLCVLIRCNVPVAILIVWISNPLTMGPMMYFAYRVGLLILGQPGVSVPDTPSLAWFTDQLATIWEPLILGCLASGFTVGITGFVAVRLYYRWRISQYLDYRKERKRTTRT